MKFELPKTAMLQDTQMKVEWLGPKIIKASHIKLLTGSTDPSLFYDFFEVH